MTLYLGTGCILYGMEHLTTGRLAERGGVNLETIRYYERRGLLPKPPRRTSGYRAFPPEAVRRVRFIKRAQALGFSLGEIRELLALRVERGTKCDDVRRRAEVKIADIGGKIRSLRRMKRALSELVVACEGEAPVGACPILAALDVEEGA